MLSVNSQVQKNSEKASTPGLSRFLKALNTREETGDTNVLKRVEDWVERKDQEFHFKATTPEIHWHKSCHSSFTSSAHILRRKRPLATDEDMLEGASASKR